MKLRLFLQYIGLLSSTGFSPLCQSSQDITTETIKEANSLQLNNLSTLRQKANLCEDYTFDDFVIGRSNELAAGMSLQASNTPNKAYNPLFLYGGTGLGKTHLMHAIGNRMLELNPDAKIRYIHLERFVSHMIKALRGDTLDKFRQYYYSLDAIFIDDVHFLSGKDRSQTEFSNLISVLIEKGAQIVLTGNQYPYAIEGIGEQLKSCMGRGLTLCVYPPEKSTRLSITHKKANEYGASLPNDVALFLASLFQTNIRELEGAVRRIFSAANITGKRITLDFTRDVLKDLISHHNKNYKISAIKIGTHKNPFVSDWLEKNIAT